MLASLFSSGAYTLVVWVKKTLQQREIEEMTLLHTSSAAYSMVRGHRTLMFKPDRSLKDYLSHCYGKMYLNPDGHISTCQSTQNHKDTHICTHPSSQNCKVILHTKKGSHTFQVQLQVFTYHIYIHTGCGVCGMGVLWALTTTTLPQRPNDKQISFLFIWFKHPDVTDKINSKKGSRMCNTL